ncbi:MAG: NAD(P)H-hydrate dehydratase [Pseudomonadota bacterium]
MNEFQPPQSPTGSVTSQDNGPHLWLDALPRPNSDSHKHSRGHLTCVTGPASQTGAARLAARGGLRVGAGLVTLLSPPDAVLINAAQVTAIMVRGFETPSELTGEVLDATACVIGPAAGVNDKTRENVLAVLRIRRPTVVDADALTVFENSPKSLFRELHGGCVLTPHPGEFRRLFPGLVERYPLHLDATKAAADSTGAVVVLKSATTIIASPGGEVYANEHASPYLATAGSGDVLAGFIGGLLAQGMDTLPAALAGVWLHGEAGLRLGPGLIAEDLPEILPSILGAMLNSALENRQASS